MRRLRGVQGRMVWGRVWRCCAWLKEMWRKCSEISRRRVLIRNGWWLRIVMSMLDAYRTSYNYGQICSPPATKIFDFGSDVYPSPGSPPSCLTPVWEYAGGQTPAAQPSSDPSSTDWKKVISNNAPSHRCWWGYSMRVVCYTVWWWREITMRVLDGKWIISLSLMIWCAVLGRLGRCWIVIRWCPLTGYSTSSARFSMEGGLMNVEIGNLWWLLPRCSSMNKHSHHPIPSPPPVTSANSKTVNGVPSWTLLTISRPWPLPIFASRLRPTPSIVTIYSTTALTPYRGWE